MISIFLIVSAANLISGQAISGSTSQCGGTGADPVTCGKATILRGQSHIGIPAACFNKVDPGPCSQDLIRIYYDHTTYTCKAFSYSGCGGNANRFVSIKNCYKLCHPYYRQRFISLGSPAKPGDDTNGSSSPDGENKAPDREREPTTTEPPEETTTPEPTTTTTTEPTTTEEDRGVLYFNSLNGDKQEVKPEIQVVHEYDQFAQPQPQPMGYAPGQPGMGGGQPSAYGPPPSNMIMPGVPNQPGGHGFLENIQHENYAPQAGQWPTSDGFRASPQQSEQIVYTH